MSKSIVPSQVFLSGLSPNPAIFDPWELEDDVEPHRPYKKGEGPTEVMTSFRVPSYMHTAMKQIVQKGLIPGINSFSDFGLDAFAFYLKRFFELGAEGFAGLQAEYENDLRQQRLLSNQRYLDSNDSTIDMLISHRDVYEMKQMLHDMIKRRDGLVNEPQPFRDKLDNQIDRVKALIAESK